MITLAQLRKTASVLLLGAFSIIGTPILSPQKASIASATWAPDHYIPSTDGLIHPGLTIWQETSRRGYFEICTLSWQVMDKRDASIDNALTAAHCVQSTNSPIYAGIKGSIYNIGHYIYVNRLDDVAVMKLNPGMRMAHSLPWEPGHRIGLSMPGELLLKNNHNHPVPIKKFGWNTGLTSGEGIRVVTYHNSPHMLLTRIHADHGDSGGPVWTMNRWGDVVPVGIVNFGIGVHPQGYDEIVVYTVEDAEDRLGFSTID